MLRSAVASKSDLGNRVEDILNSGKLVSDDIIIELINDRINQSDCKSGYLFDGVPRTLGQANLFLQNDIEVNKVIDISLDDELIGIYQNFNAITYEDIFKPLMDSSNTVT